MSTIFKDSSDTLTLKYGLKGLAEIPGYTDQNNATSGYTIRFYLYDDNNQLIGNASKNAVEEALEGNLGFIYTADYSGLPTGTYRYRYDIYKNRSIGGIRVATGSGTVNYDRKVQDVYSKVENLEDKLDIVDTNIDTLLTNLGALDTKVDTVANDLGTSIDEAKNRVIANHDKLTLIDGKFAPLGAAIGDTSTKIDDANTKLEAVQTALGNIDTSQIGNINTAVTNLNDTASGLETTLSGVVSQVQSIVSNTDEAYVAKLFLPETVSLVDDTPVELDVANSYALFTLEGAEITTGISATFNVVDPDNADVSLVAGKASLSKAGNYLISVTVTYTVGSTSIIRRAVAFVRVIDNKVSIFDGSSLV